MANGHLDDLEYIFTTILLVLLLLIKLSLKQKQNKNFYRAPMNPILRNTAGQSQKSFGWRTNLSYSSSYLFTQPHLRLFFSSLLVLNPSTGNSPNPPC